MLVLPRDERGGAEAVLLTVAQELASRPDWQVTIMVLGQAMDRPYIGTANPKFRMSFGRGKGMALSEFSLLPRLVFKKPDLILSSHMRVNAFLAACRRIGLIRCGRLVARESTVLLDRYRGVRAAIYRLMYGVYGSQDLIVAQTDYMKTRLEDVIGAAARRLRVVPNPIDIDKVRERALAPLPAPPIPGFDGPLVVWCGRLIEIKQPLIAIETLHALRERTGRDIGLVMVGDGPMRGAAEAKIAELNLQTRVRLVGNVDNPHPYFRRAEFGLLTSRREGFPNVLLEMMAAGTPAICTTPCAGDLDSLSGVSVAPDFEPSSLATTLIEAQTSGDRSSAYAAALARRTPQHFVNELLR